MPSTRLLGVRIDCVDDAYILARMRTALEGGDPITVTYVHFDTLLLAYDRPDIRTALEQADIVFPDGIAVHAALQFVSSKFIPRFRGTCLTTDAMRLCARRGKRVICIGGTPEVSSSLPDALQRLGFLRSDILALDGWTSYNPDELTARAIAFNPSMIVLGMGGEKQVRALVRFKEISGVAVLLTVGGLFDSLSKHTWGPPVWIWSVGLEWLVRLVQEPRRLWRRYLLRFPRFALLVLQELMRSR